MKDPWAHERVKKDRRELPVSGAAHGRSTRARSASGRRVSPLLVAGLGVGGWLLYSLIKNKAFAGVLPTPPLMPVSYGSGSSPYTAAALNASVPGVSFAPSSLQPGILTSTLTGVPAVTGGQVAAAQSFWSTLQPVAAIDSGYITFPSGSQVAAALLSGGNTAMDANGNYYVAWAGQVYMLGSQDSSGNWPALLVGS